MEVLYHIATPLSLQKFLRYAITPYASFVLGFRRWYTFFLRTRDQLHGWTADVSKKIPALFVADELWEFSSSEEQHAHVLLIKSNLLIMFSRLSHYFQWSSNVCHKRIINASQSLAHPNFLPCSSMLLYTLSLVYFSMVVLVCILVFSDIFDCVVNFNCLGWVLLRTHGNVIYSLFQICHIRLTGLHFFHKLKMYKINRRLGTWRKGYWVPIVFRSSVMPKFFCEREAELMITFLLIHFMKAVAHPCPHITL